MTQANHVYLFPNGEVPSNREEAIINAVARVEFHPDPNSDLLIHFNVNQTININGQDRQIGEWLFDALWWKGSNDSIGFPETLDTDPVLAWAREIWEKQGLPTAVFDKATLRHTDGAYLAERTDQRYTPYVALNGAFKVQLQRVELGDIRSVMSDTTALDRCLDLPIPPPSPQEILSQILGGGPIPGALNEMLGGPPCTCEKCTARREAEQQGQQPTDTPLGLLNLPSLDDLEQEEPEEYPTD